MDSHDVESYFRQHRKILAVVFLMVGMLAVSGLFMGMRQNEDHATRRLIPTDEVIPPGHDLPTAPKYGEIAVADWLANRDWKFTLADLPRATEPPVPGEIALPAERATALADRKQLRAYDGVPPVVPHAIDNLSVAACRTCHGEGANKVIGGVRPAEVSHPWIANCTSCHVAQDGLRRFTLPAVDRLVVENSFRGRESAGPGKRANDISPPTMPHQIWMRQNCMACHSAGREQAIRTSHPERSNCLQCHAPDARFDNRESYLRPLPESAPLTSPASK